MGGAEPEIDQKRRPGGSDETQSYTKRCGVQRRALFSEALGLAGPRTWAYAGPGCMVPYRRAEHAV
jgi:hypothetical protein